MRAGSPNPLPLFQRRISSARAVVSPWLLRPATSAFETYRWARIVRFPPEARSRSAATSAMTAPSTRGLAKCADVPGDTRNFHLGDGGMRADPACVPPIRYQVCAQDGTVHAVHIRIDLAKGKKKFTWELQDGTKDLAGRPVKTLPLYRSETLRALNPGALVLVCEGEKATDAAVALGFDAVGTVTGSSGLPSDTVLHTLDGFHVAGWPDADVVGSKHMGRLLEACHRLRGGMGAGLSLVDPGVLGLTGQGDDADDWTPKDDAEDEVFFAMRPWSPPAPPADGPPPEDDEEPPIPEDNPERPSGYMVPEGKTRAGLIKALEWVGIDVRFNERSARMELQDAIAAAAGTPNWETSDDLRGAKIREMVADTCLYLGAKGVPSRLQFGRERWGDVLDAILDDRRVDPFKIWLNALPPWDSEDRLDFWLGHVFTVGDIHEDLLSWASRSVLMGVVLRTDHPGEKHDEMVVLVGPQGIGKSTAWAWLLPGEPNRSIWFSDSLSFHDDRKAKAEALQGMVLVEASEMTGSTKAEVEMIKKFLSMTNDNIRLTYRRDPSPLLRRCMIVGTTNDPRCLPNDPSGNRRFVPVPCTAGDPAATRAYLDEHRDQLWAEALHRARVNKETAYLPDSLKAAQAELTEQFRAVDEVAEDVIGSWLADNPRPVTANQVVTGVSWTADSRSVYRITTVLKQLGYTRVQHRVGNSSRHWFWHPPHTPQLEF